MQFVELRNKLTAVHSAINDALGDSDIMHMADDELRDEYPAQWAAMKLAQIIADLETV